MKTVKGFQDFVGPEAAKRVKVLEIIRGEFETYGFEPAETPTVEYEEFVKSGANNNTISEIFKLQDRGERELALRYEFTFQLARIARNQKLPYKRYQIGRVFRDEPTGINRFREFTQCDADIVGASIKDEAEVLSLAKNILDKVGIKCIIYFNNRKLLNEVLVDVGVKERDREQVIRELDKLDRLSKKEVADSLKTFGAEKLLEIFEDKKNLTKYNFYKEIRDIEKLAKIYGLKLEFSPTLARGLAYYNGTIFEIKSKDIKETICAGGAYLIDDVQAFGFSFGLDRVTSLSDVIGGDVEYLILSLGEDVAAIGLAKKMRTKGICVSLLLDKSIGKGLEYANSKRIKKVVFVGKDEVGKGKFRVKDMESGKESLIEEI